MREAGLVADMDHLNRSVKAQFKYANRLMADYTIVIGEEELSKGAVKLRNMGDGEEIEVALNNIISTLQQNIVCNRG